MMHGGNLKLTQFNIVCAYILYTLTQFNTICEHYDTSLYKSHKLKQSILTSIHQMYWTAGVM